MIRVKKPTILNPSSDFKVSGAITYIPDSPHNLYDDGTGGTIQKFFELGAKRVVFNSDGSVTAHYPPEKFVPEATEKPLALAI